MMLTCCSAMCYNVSMHALDADPDEDAGSTPSAKELLIIVLLAAAATFVLKLFGVDVSEVRVP